MATSANETYDSTLGGQFSNQGGGSGYFDVSGPLGESGFAFRLIGQHKDEDYWRNFGTNRVFKIACGPNGANYNWTEVLMSMAGRRMDGLSVHYYTVPTGNWASKGPATGFAEDQWFSTLRQTLRMDELITRHAAIMDKAEAGQGAGPANRPGGGKKVGMVVDEWGTWYDAEKGSKPGFLYQHAWFS